jgi:prevent-host-death family protein
MQLVMKTILISEFKAKCIGLLKEVRKTGQPLTVTLRGEPLVRVEPIHTEKRRPKLGTLKGQMSIKGDIIKSDMEGDWAEQ